MHYVLSSQLNNYLLITGMRTYLSYDTPPPLLSTYSTYPAIPTSPTNLKTTPTHLPSGKYGYYLSVSWNRYCMSGFPCSQLRP